jgi:NAD(P)-dependent dehydrogenase (short-subunit alcohol dehydrogenase family)
MAKVAIVTGASRGIGRSIAERLAHDGFSVVVNYAGNQAEAGEVVKQIQSKGGKAVTIKANVGNKEDVDRIFQETLKVFGQVDVVVNNAGIMPLSLIAKEDAEMPFRVVRFIFCFRIVSTWARSYIKESRIRANTQRLLTEISGIWFRNNSKLTFRPSEQGPEQPTRAC